MTSMYICSEVYVLGFDMWCFALTETCVSSFRKHDGAAYQLVRVMGSLGKCSSSACLRDGKRPNLETRDI